MSEASPMVSGSEQLERLLSRMSGKDEAAFEKLYLVTKRKLFSTVLPIVKRRHLAEEVVQETYVRIWLNAALYKPSLGSPMIWMITIARNLAIDMARKPVREIQSVTQSCLVFRPRAPLPSKPSRSWKTKGTPLISGLMFCMRCWHWTPHDVISSSPPTFAVKAGSNFRNATACRSTLSRPGSDARCWRHGHAS